MCHMYQLGRHKGFGDLSLSRPRNVLAMLRIRDDSWMRLLEDEIRELGRLAIWILDLENQNLSILLHSSVRRTELQPSMAAIS